MYFKYLSCFGVMLCSGHAGQASFKSFKCMHLYYMQVANGILNIAANEKKTCLIVSFIAFNKNQFINIDPTASDKPKNNNKCPNTRN